MQVTEEELKRWAVALDQTLTRKSYICDLHFCHDDINKFDKKKNKPSKLWRLKKVARPSFQVSMKIINVNKYVVYILVSKTSCTNICYVSCCSFKILLSPSRK